MKQIRSLLSLIILFSILNSCEIKTAEIRNLALNRAAYHSTSMDYFQTGHLATDGESSTYWRSNKEEKQSLMIDLGARSVVSGFKINWGEPFAISYKIYISNDSSEPDNWTVVYSTDEGDGDLDEIPISDTKARYVKLETTNSSSDDGYLIKEFGVFGTGGYIHPVEANNMVNENGALYLTNGWKLIKAPFVNGEKLEISSVGYDDSNWLPAKVPGTILASYLDLGAIPDPNYGDQQFQISDSFSRTNYWYRNEIEIPSEFTADQIWINFDGINYDATIYINKILVGSIRGTFAQKKFDISEYVTPGSKAAVAIRLAPPPYPTEIMTKTPDSTTFNLEYGLNSPTWIPAGAWDWIITIRDRNTGIWNDVYLTHSRGVTIENPWVISDLKLPDTTQARLSIQSELVNHSNRVIEGTLKYNIQPGNIELNQKIKLEANETKLVSINPSTHPKLVFNNPYLWWPNGYGNQHLYTMDAQFLTKTEVADTKSIRFGIREFSYEPKPEATILSVNGHRVMAKGGNWGISESMIRFSKEEFKNAIKMHQELNFTMIRNWSGSVADKHFYEFCDEYGILVWDEFWYSGGPKPTDTDLFMDNAITKIKRRRHHASLAVWAGANETELPQPMYDEIPAAIEDLDGTRLYVHQSADGLVRGGGPWVTQDPKFWFGDNARGFMTEVGMTTVPSLESMQEMMPEEDLWPINEMWALHDFIYRSYPNSNVYADQIDQRFGTAKDIEDFTKKAQLLNMEDYKAIYEGFMAKLFDDASAVMVWMSHPAWPSLVWQIYDYYWEPTGAYWGTKKASEPIHILWNPIDENIITVNHSKNDLEQIDAVATIYNLDGSIQSTQQKRIDIEKSSTTNAFTMRYPENVSETHFIKLTLKKGDALLSENFYWRGNEYLNYQALESMETASLLSAATISENGKEKTIQLELTNDSNPVALAIRLKLVQEESGKRVLPAFYEDNYFSLLPGETRTLTITFDERYLQGDSPLIMLEGWNIDDIEVQITN